jgi:hypothetical protein
VKTFLRTALLIGTFTAAFVPAVSSFAGAAKKGEKKCEKKDKPAACPGGGGPECKDGKWECKPLPTKKECDAGKKPAACPGGGGPECKDGTWECKPLPKGK